MTERIDGRCPCGQKLVGMIDDGSLRFYTVDWEGRTTRHLVRCHLCPVCGRDFSKITAEQLKENAWPT